MLNVPDNTLNIYAKCCPGNVVGRVGNKKLINSLGGGMHTAAN